jgi:hypothetical protein
MVMASGCIKAAIIRILIPQQEIGDFVIEVDIRPLRRSDTQCSNTP